MVLLVNLFDDIFYLRSWHLSRIHHCYQRFVRSRFLLFPGTRVKASAWFCADGISSILTLKFIVSIISLNIPIQRFTSSSAVPLNFIVSRLVIEFVSHLTNVAKSLIKTISFYSPINCQGNSAIGCDQLGNMDVCMIILFSKPSWILDNFYVDFQQYSNTDIASVTPDNAVISVTSIPMDPLH